MRSTEGARCASKYVANSYCSQKAYPYFFKFCIKEGSHKNSRFYASHNSYSPIPNIR
nr:hypothetical protein [Cressdnaviricota sp.]